MRHNRITALLAAFALLLAGCGASGAGSAPGRSVAAAASEKAAGGYEAPPFRGAAFHADQAQGPAGAKVDVSAVAQGYVAVSAESSARLKFQVKAGDETYTYNLASDGTPSVFPLTCGSGKYLFRVMENTGGSKYAERYALSCSVALEDEFQPFLRPSDYVFYTEDSNCVRKAARFAAEAADELELVKAVYRFVTSSVKYDRDKAATVQSGYLPDPDETMRTGKGICFDYASLAAAMLRSQGIPTKEIFGYVSPDGVYHAWNMFYTTMTGWVTVSFEVSGEEWTRMDLTFAANGASASFIGDGTNYTDVYCY